MARQRIVAGNWKMNTSFDQGVNLAKHISLNIKPSKALAILAPPFISLQGVSRKIEYNPAIKLAAQNCHLEEKGAYTGEVSIDMLISVGVEYVILGHSERRAYNKETNELIAKKVKLVLSKGLTPIFCCGESLAKRKAKKHIEFVSSQLKESLFGLKTTDFEKVVIAYEPIWAIGTGVTASPKEAQDMHKSIRNLIAKKYSKKVANDTTILYGGSVKAANAKELFSKRDVDGGLVGGASLKGDDFLAIIDSF